MEVQFYAASPAILWIAVDRSATPRRWGLLSLVAASLAPVLAQGILMARRGAGPDVFPLLGNGFPPTYTRPYWRCPVGRRSCGGCWEWGVPSGCLVTSRPPSPRTPVALMRVRCLAFTPPSCPVAPLPCTALLRWLLRRHRSVLRAPPPPRPAHHRATARRRGRGGRGGHGHACHRRRCRARSQAQQAGEHGQHGLGQGQQQCRWWRRLPDPGTAGRGSHDAIRGGHAATRRN